MERHRDAGFRKVPWGPVERDLKKRRSWTNEQSRWKVPEAWPMTWGSHVSCVFQQDLSKVDLGVYELTLSCSRPMAGNIGRQVQVKYMEKPWSNSMGSGNFIRE